MALTARQVETARPKEKDYKLSDERGLYLLVKTTGARYWRLKYRIAGKEKKLALGVYPDVSLAEARIKRDNARKIISEGGDPGEKKRKEKLTQKISATNGTSINLYHGLKVTPEAYWRLWIKIFSRIWANEALLISSRWKCWKFCAA
mgnify:CR=1 FL=1